jgi:anti-sigma factor (TIGR02949 family)
MISCTDAVRQLWDYLEGSIEPSGRIKIEEHLDVCKRCCGEVEFADELRSFLEEHGREDLPSDARTRLTSYLDEL